MNKTDIIFRKAVADDAGFISKAMLAALGVGDFLSAPKKDLEVIEEIVKRNDTLYSYENVLVAEVDGKCAGCMIAYDGGRYPGMREVTFKLLKDELDMDYAQMPDETHEGEYYMDSLAVSPEFRQRGIGKSLMMKSLELGKSIGFTQASLLVLATDQGLQRLYKSCGFEPVGLQDCFGKKYLRMVASLKF